MNNLILTPDDPGFGFFLATAANPRTFTDRTGESYSVLPDENGIPQLYQGEELKDALLGGYYEHLLNGDNLFDPDGIKQDLRLFESGFEDNLHYAIDL